MAGVPRYQHWTEMRLTLFYPWLQVSMHSKDMLRNHSIPLFVCVIRDHKEQIETREKRIWERNIPMGVFMHVILID